MSRQKRKPRRGGGGERPRDHVLTQADLDLLPEKDYKHYESLPDTDLAKEAKKLKITLNGEVGRSQVVEKVLMAANPEALPDTHFSGPELAPADEAARVRLWGQ